VTTPFLMESLSPGHDRAAFSSGVEALDRYLRQQAMQDIRRRVAACFVAVEAESRTIAGYYTLSAAGVPLLEMPQTLVKDLPRYGAVPVARLGRLAVDTRYQGQKLGGALIWDAVARCLRSEVAVFALIVDAKGETAKSFYRHHGFIPFADSSLQLVLPLSGLRQGK